mgnify:CR=1 FL=1
MSIPIIIKLIYFTDTLLNHFMNFEWNKMHQFSFDWNFNEIYKYTGVKIYDEHFDRKKVKLKI